MSQSSSYGKTTSLRTKAIHGPGQTRSWEFSHHLVPPMTASTTFRLESLSRGAQGFMNFAGAETGEDPILIYDRLDEPTTLMLEEHLALIHKAETAISFGSGMGAISSVLMSLLKSGDKIFAHRTMYGCTFTLLTHWLPRFGIQPQLTDLRQQKWSEVLKDHSVRVIYFESMANPNLEMIDIPELVQAVRWANKSRSEDQQVYIVIDNTFATPWALRPLEMGVDFVVESLTKNISGFGTEMGGAVMTSRKHEAALKLARKDFGAIMNPYSAWHIMVYGIPTQSLRFEKQQQNAQSVAEFLNKHPLVEKVIYPGLANFEQKALAQKLLVSPEGKFSPGTMLAFTLKGDLKFCSEFVDDIAKHSYSITLAVSLGLTKTLIEVPGAMTHSAIPVEDQMKSGIDPRLIRLSLGLENEQDLIADLSVALDRLKYKHSESVDLEYSI